MFIAKLATTARLWRKARERHTSYSLLIGRGASVAVWKRDRGVGGHRVRRSRWSITEYSRDLPEGIAIRWSHQFQKFHLIQVPGGLVIAERTEEQVRAWERPEKVFAYIARRAMGKRKDSV